MDKSRLDDLSHFVAEQTLMKRLVAESTLPRLELDISENDIADWMAQTGEYISIKVTRNK